MTSLALWLLCLQLIAKTIGHEGTVLPLKRLTPHELNLTQLKAIDSARHGRLLQSPVRGVFSFPVEAGAQPIFRLHYTTLKLGTPPKEFNVVIDTGSDVLWVSCVSCVGCPKTAEFQNVSFFDPLASSSAVKMACSDKRCHSLKSACSPLEACSYKLEYGDGSFTSGDYLSDVISFHTVISSNMTVESSAPFVFGCSSSVGGHLSQTQTPVRGILGLGKGRESLLSQLSSQGLVRGVFSLCLSGDKDTVGVMVLGENKMPSTVYTPLLRSRTHYNVKLKTVSVNDVILPIHPSVFSVGYGTIIDSGTILAYFPAEAYVPLVDAISNVVSLYGRPITFESFQCYDFTSGLSSHEVVAGMFPEVNLGFAGGASMVLRPQAYVFQSFPDLGNAIHCIAFRIAESHHITIIGEVALRDRMIVHDFDHHRIGWTDYNCSLEVTQNNDIINTKQWKGKSTKTCIRSYLLQVALMIPLFLHLFFL